MADTLTSIHLNHSASAFLREPRKMLIGGKWVEAASGKSFDTFNPATGEVLTTVPEGDREDIDRAVNAARKAFESGPWPNKTPSERGRLLWKLADLLEELCILKNDVGRLAPQLERNFLKISRGSLHHQFANFGSTRQ